jgi:hypothetical protein
MVLIQDQSEYSAHWPRRHHPGPTVARFLGAEMSAPAHPLRLPCSKRTGEENPMKFICLVYGDETMFQSFTKEASAKLDADSIAYDRSLEASGKFVAAEALQSVRTSKLVRRRGGKTLVTDGPFAETKEQLLGFVMIDASDLEDALKIAAGIPLAALGSVEVRAVYDVPGS